MPDTLKSMPVRFVSFYRVRTLAEIILIGKSRNILLGRADACSCMTDDRHTPIMSTRLSGVPNRIFIMCQAA